MTHPASDDSIADCAIGAVVFDLDDTLYPERDYVRSGYRAVAERLRRRPAGRGLRAEDGRGGPFEDWLWDRFCRGESAGAFDALNDRFALGLDAKGIADLVAAYRGHSPAIQPYPGVAEMLQGLGRSCRLGLLTDGFLPAQRLKLDALGLERLFHAVVFTEDLGRDCWKPSPAGFEAIAARLGVPHARLAYVADNPAKDFLAPNRLGWRTIRFLCDGQVHSSRPAAPGGEPQKTIRCWDELPAALGLPPA